MAKCLIFFLIPFLSFSQIEISGQIKDSIGGVEFANIVLLDNEGRIVVGGITDENGNFKLHTKRGRYNINISFIGYTEINREINLLDNTDIGIIKLKKAEDVLNEVIVRASKPLIERKIDRLVFNVENSIIASGGDVLDALKVTPNIHMRNDQIALIGKSSMSVMIDGKIILLNGNDLIQFLKTISSENVKSIEVITNPPAQYDVEGNSGLINIVLKKIKNDSWSSSVYSTYEQGTYPVGAAGGSFNFQKNKYTFSTNLNYRKGSSYSKDIEKINYPDQNWNGRSDMKDYSNVISGKLGFGYKIKENLEFSTQYIGTYSKPDIREDNIVKLSSINNHQIDSTLETSRFNSKRNISNVLNLYGKYTLDTIGTNITLNVDYFDYLKKNDQQFSTRTFDENDLENQDSYISINNIANQHIENISINLDVEHPHHWLKLNYGGKISSTDTQNDIDFYNLSSGNPIYDINQSNKFLYKEKVQALYISGLKNFKSWSVKVGLRLETTQTEGNSITSNIITKTNYSQLFPTAYISYELNENNSFSLNYGKRISRPRFSMVNPFRTYINSFSVIEGNPFLQPSFSHNIELGHTYKGNLSSTLYYSYTTNDYSLLTIIDDNSINQTTKPLNFIDRYNVGVRESYSLNLFNWWQTFNSLSFYYSKSLSNNINTERITEGLGAFVYSSSSIYLNQNKTFSGSIDLFYSFPSTYGISRNKNVFNTDLGVRYSIWDKKLKINLSVRDIFKTNRNVWTEEINSIKITRSNFQDNQVLKLSVIYDFGNNKVQVEDIKAQNNAEKNRSN